MRTPPIVVRDFLIDDEIFLGEPLVEGAFRLRLRAKHEHGAHVYMLIENGDWYRVARLASNGIGGDTAVIRPKINREAAGQ